jgi:hypothetical protein
VQNEPEFDLVDIHTHRSISEAVTPEDIVAGLQWKYATGNFGCRTLPTAKVRQ